VAIEKAKVEEAVNAFMSLLEASQPAQINEIRCALTDIPAERCAKLFAFEPQLGHTFVGLLRQAWPNAGERLRYEISLAAEVLMDVLTNEQAERFGLPAVLMLLAGCGADNAKGSIYTIIFNSGGRPDKNLLRTACRILIPMEDDEDFLCKAAIGLRHCRTEPWLLELAPILKEKLGSALFERAVIQGLVMKSDTPKSEVLEVLAIIEPALQSEGGLHFAQEVKKGLPPLEVMHAMYESGEWQKATRRRRDPEA
jgi:hypothetical protein